jgi:hypothetical protein
MSRREHIGCGKPRIAHQRRTVPPAADHLGGDELGRLCLHALRERRLQPIAFPLAEAPESIDILLQLAHGEVAAIPPQVAIGIDDVAAELGRGVGRDRKQIVRIVDRRQRGAGREIAAIVGIAQDELARFDQMDRIGAAQRLVGAADHRLGNAVEESEGLALGAEPRRFRFLLAGQLAERDLAPDLMAVPLESGRRCRDQVPEAILAAGIEHEHAVDILPLRVAPPPGVGRVVADIAEHARAPGRGHPVDEGGRKGCDAVCGQAELG